MEPVERRGSLLVAERAELRLVLHDEALQPQEPHPIAGSPGEPGRQGGSLSVGGPACLVQQFGIQGDRDSLNGHTPTVVLSSACGPHIRWEERVPFTSSERVADSVRMPGCEGGCDGST